ncbi:putative adhesin [Salmonella enterica]
MITRGENAGHGYAASVSPGGRGTVLAGHGGSRFGDKMIVPEGTSITIPRDGIRITDLTGKLLESGNIDELIKAASNNPRVASDLEGWVTHLPGAQIPDYILKPPVDLNILSNSITVDSSTYLSQLLKPDQGNVVWAACTEYFK